MKKSCMGVGLIECVITLALVGIIFCASVPSVRAARNASLTKQEAKRLAAWLDHVAIRSLHRGSDFIVQGNETELRATDTGRPKKSVSRFVSRGKVSVTVGRAALMYYRTGVASPASILVRGISDRCYVRISLRGRASVDCAP